MLALRVGSGIATRITPVPYLVNARRAATVRDVGQLSFAASGVTRGKGYLHVAWGPARDRLAHRSCEEAELGLDYRDCDYNVAYRHRRKLVSIGNCLS